MKIIDKFLKFLKTDRNTFLTYILTVITIYLAVDRIVEMMFMILSGTSVSYWGPLQYTLAIACPIFAFLFSGSSSFVTHDKIKLSFFYLYCIALYIIGVSMVVQWVNLLCWLLLMATPGYVGVVSDFSNLIAPAFQSIAVYLPLTTFYPLFKKLFAWINDTKDLKDSILDYGGIDLSKKKGNSGAYSVEMPLYANKETGQIIKIPEQGRFQSCFICGVSGSGKTSMMLEPMMAKDIEKKHFFKEASKELGFTALKTGIASLKYPYDNKYLNNNFNLNMLSVNSGKDKIFKAFLRKMIAFESENQIVYKDLGFTSISPDFESTSRILEVAKNYNIPVNLIDPADPNSPGLNPFAFDDPVKIAIIISSVLKEMYTYAGTDLEESFRQNTTLQAVENISILLKEMYPRLNGDLLPTLEDMLNMFNDFSLVEKMCKQLEEIPELAKKYELQLGYFKKHFYSDGINKEETEKYITGATTQLDTLLRVQGVKNILCNRTNNLNYDNTLANGEITLVCTRRGDLGATVHTAFGLFFLLLMQYSVLRRPGNEKSRTPHFLYIDEFPDFITHATTNMFTLYRKYRVGLIISAQNLRQLGEQKRSKYRETILANCSNKFIFVNNTPEEPNYAASKIQSLKAKQCMYKVKDTSGKNQVGIMRVDFLDSKYTEPHLDKQYNFSKFTTGTYSDDSGEKTTKKKKFDLKNLKFDTDSSGDVDPIKTNTTDSNFLLDNDDAIIFDIKRNNNN